ncbi:MAG: HNH endonuclease [Chitinophagaceae bacterium]|nr:HNH endonuclease [Chitinophagaceae bacterium]
MKRDPREAQIDHIDPKNPKDKSKTPGSNSNSNLQVLSGEENIKKSNK